MLTKQNIVDVVLRALDKAFPQRNLITEVHLTEFRRIVREALTRPLPVEHHSWALDLPRQNYTVTVDRNNIWAIPPDASVVVTKEKDALDFLERFPQHAKHLSLKKDDGSFTRFSPPDNASAEWQQFKIDGYKRYPEWVRLTLLDEQKQRIWQAVIENMERASYESAIAEAQDRNQWKRETERNWTDTLTPEEWDKQRERIERQAPRRNKDILDDFDPLTPRPWKWEE